MCNCRRSPARREDGSWGRMRRTELLDAGVGENGITGEDRGLIQVACVRRVGGDH